MWLPTNKANECAGYMCFDYSLDKAIMNLKLHIHQMQLNALCIFLVSYSIVCKFQPDFYLHLAIHY